MSINKWRYLDLTIAQVVVGLNVVMAKSLLENMPAFIYIELRFLLSTILLAVFFLFSKQRLYLKPKKGRPVLFQDLSLLSGLALTGGVLFNVIMTFGLEYTSAANAGIISATLPAMAVALSVWLLKERMTALMGLAIVLAVAGVLVLNIDPKPTEFSGSPWLGNLIVFLAMVPEAFYTILNKISSKRFSPLGTAFFASLLTAVFMLPLAFYTEESVSSILWTPELLILLGCSACAALLFYWLWARGLEGVPASTASLFGGIMPVAAVVAGVTWLHEPFGFWQIVGMILVIWSIILGARSTRGS